LVIPAGIHPENPLVSETSQALEWKLMHEII